MLDMFVTENAKPALSSDKAKKKPLALQQKTIRGSVQCVGVGLHSGQVTTLTLKPSEANQGVVFRRTDLGTSSTDITDIPAVWQNVVESSLCTRIQNAAGTNVSTIEHLMAALAGLEIDNLLIEIDGPEVPIMDGSSAPFIFLLECAGLMELESPRAYIEILKHVTVMEPNGTGMKIASVAPSNRQYKIDCEITFSSQAIGQQNYSLSFSPTSFKNDISRARTFGFLEEVDKMRSMGLALGGSLENSVVVDGDKVMNEDGLRYADEFVRHKVLDCIGDLYLAGYPILGKVETNRSGHALNNRLLRALFADSTAWRLTKPALEEAAAEQNNSPLPESLSA